MALWNRRDLPAPTTTIWRVIALAVTAGLFALLWGCGNKSDDATDDSASAPADVDWSAVSISGAVGSAPTVDFNSAVSVTGTASKVLTQGSESGTANDGDTVNAYIWLGDATTQKKAFSDWDQGKPEQLPVDATQLSQFWVDLLKGQHFGSRIAAFTPASDVVGDQGSDQLGISASDTVLVVVDLMSKVQPVKPTDVPASQMPSIVEQDGKPTALDFSGVPKPSKNGKLLRTIVKKGDGAPLTAGQTITANYLGAVYGAKKPFDESYSGDPLTSPLSGLVEGWRDGLVGVPVGSRVILQIPPDLGYGSQAQQGIPANSTLYFVLDIVSAQ